MSRRSAISRWLSAVMVSCSDWRVHRGAPQASPPQMSWPPLSPKRRQRRLVSRMACRRARSPSPPSAGSPDDGRSSCHRWQSALPKANSGHARRCRRTASRSQGSHVVAKAGDAVERAGFGIVAKFHVLVPSCRSRRVRFGFRAP